MAELTHSLTVEGAASLEAKYLRRVSDQLACGRPVDRVPAILARAAHMLEACAAALRGRPGAR